MGKQEQLKSLNKKWARDCACALRAVATQPVFGNGNTEASILFIGEAPGKKEDACGIPFVGSSGKFLDELLASIALRREDVYITNIVKYRPPDNRDPRPEEISACLKWLEEEIKIINPKLIVTLGRHALSHFLPKGKISEMHGKVFQQDISGIGSKKIFPLYHPAAALYNGSFRSTLVRDFKKIVKI